MKLPAFNKLGIQIGSPCLVNEVLWPSLLRECDLKKLINN